MREQIIQEAKALLDKDPLFLDTETTGLRSKDEIVEIAILDKAGSVILNSLIKPTVAIRPEAMAVHHIGPEQVIHAPHFSDIGPAIKRVLEGRTVAIYNATFDVRMLRQSANSDGDCEWDITFEAVCVMCAFADFRGVWDATWKRNKWHKLGAAADYCSIEIPKNMHRAAADAELARRVLFFMAEYEAVQPG